MVNLQEKWASILDKEGPGLTKITDARKRQHMAQLLENQYTWSKRDRGEDMSLNESSSTPSTVDSNVSKYDPILISMARRAMPNLMAYDVCGVQPMNGPTGLVFSQRPRYVKKGTKEAGDTAFYNEPDTSHSGTGNHSDLEIFNGPSAGTMSTGSGMETRAAELLGTDSGSAWNEMTMTIDKFSIQAKSRKLKAEWSREVEQDYAAIHGGSMQSELSNIVSSEIIAEINREVIRTVYAIAKIGGKSLSQPGYFDFATDADGRWAGERFSMLLLQIELDANEIARDTRIGKGNRVICSSEVANALSMAGKLLHNSGDNNLQVDDTGNTFAGRLSNGMPVYIDPYALENYYIVGFKGAEEMNAGLYYCPYVPLQMAQTIGEDSFQPRLGFMTRYALAPSPFAQGNEGLSLDAEGNAIIKPNANSYYRKVAVGPIMGYNA